jgi:quercetin dioxygenase-like cupin family protein
MSFSLTDPNGIHIPAAEGVTRWFSGDVYTMRLTAAQTGGRISAIEASVPPGGGPIPHSHPEQSETFYLLDGELEFLNGDQTLVARTGDMVHIPPNTVHRFHNAGVHHTRLLFLYTPGGPEDLFLDLGDEPQPGVQVAPWGPERFTPELIEHAIKTGHIPS